MKITITLIHNKSDKENQAQVEFFKDLIQEIIEDRGQDEDGNPITETYSVFKDLDIPHTVEFYQITPFQPDNKSKPYNAVLTPNMHDLPGPNVQYGKGDEDKVGDHPRFFNWGLKRGTDYGGDISIYVPDVNDFNLDDLKYQVNSLIDPEDKHEFAESGSIKLATVKSLIEVGQLDETKPLDEAFTNLKERVIVKGMRVA